MQIQRTFLDATPTLFLITSPIGNLQTVSNALQPLLAKLKYLLCEDSRITQKLLDHLGISHLTLISYHKFNEQQRLPKILALLQAGNNLGLISCAGTPLIADPGYKLVRTVLAHNYFVTSIGLNNSALVGLITSGLPTQTFYFVNFLAHKSQQKARLLEKLTSFSTTLIFFEAVHRLKATLQLMQTVWRERRFALARELTKKYETIYRGQLSMLKLEKIHYKGEFVIIIDNNLSKQAQKKLQAKRFSAAVVDLGLSTQQERKLRKHWE